MSASIRNLAGVSAAVLTIGLVLATAIATPNPAPTRQASADCPNALKTKAPPRVAAGA